MIFVCPFSAPWWEGTSKLIVISHLSVWFWVCPLPAKCRIQGCPVTLQLDSLPTLCCGHLYSQKLLAILRVCLLLLASILFPGYLISVFPLRESVWGRDCFSSSVSLHFCVFRLPSFLFPTPQKKKSLACRKQNQSSFRQCLKSGGRESQPELEAVSRRDGVLRAGK